MRIGMASLPAAVSTARTTVSSEALPELGRDRQAAAQHRHGAGAAEVLLLVGLVGAAALAVVAAGRRRVGEDVDDGVVLVELDAGRVMPRPAS